MLSLDKLSKKKKKRKEKKRNEKAVRQSTRDYYRYFLRVSSGATYYEDRETSECKSNHLLYT